MGKDRTWRNRRNENESTDLESLSGADFQRGFLDVVGPDSGDETDLRDELLQVEARISARLRENEKALAEMKRLRVEDYGARSGTGRPKAQAAYRGNSDERVIAGIKLAVAEVLRREMADSPGASMRDELHKMETRVREQIRHLDERLVEAMQRIERVERGEFAGAGSGEKMDHAVAEIRREVSDLHRLVADDLVGFEKSLERQAGAIDSVRTAIAQTDDLVERMAEALQVMQSPVFDRTEERAVAVS